MIKRLILFIVIFAIFLAFITFNLGNSCSISFGSPTLTIPNVPVFLTVFISFFAGFICALPLVFTVGKKSKNNTEKSKIPVSKEKSSSGFLGGKYFTKKNKTEDGSDDTK